MNRTWRTEATLWRHSCSHGGEALAHHNLAMALPSRTGAEQAVRRRELERALELKPGYILAHINLGLLQIDTLAVDAGLARIQAAVEFNRELPQSWYWLARANFGQQRWADAAVAAVQAATRQPGALDYQYTAGRYLQFADRVAESIPFLRRVAAIDPDYSDTRYLLGYALQTVGQRAAAIALYEEFVAQRADHDRAFFNLGLARMQDADWGRAIAAFTACLASNPANHKAHLRLAECYRSSGDAAQAARHQAIYDQSK
jgi:tetratricopeptide (TPR) repeat protein